MFALESILWTNFCSSPDKAVAPNPRPSPTTIISKPKEETMSDEKASYQERLKPTDASGRRRAILITGERKRAESTESETDSDRVFLFGPSSRPESSLSC